MKMHEGQGGGGVGRKLHPFSLVDEISINNQMAKQLSAVENNFVAVLIGVQNVEFVCNVGGSSSLHTTMNTTARLMQPLRCAATHLKTSQRILQHVSTHSARKHLHDKRGAQHSTRAAAAAPALSSRDPTSHAPLSTQPSAPSSWRSRAHRQVRWPVDGTRSPRSRT